MGYLILIFNIIVIIVSVISVVSHLGSKGKARKNARTIQKDFSPHRKITSKELNAINILFPNKNFADSTSDVFKISGPYESQELKYRGGAVSKNHFIGGIEIKWYPSMENLIQNNNSIEAVFLPNGRAIVLTLNNNFSIIDEASVKSAVSDTSGSTEGILTGEVVTENSVLKPLNVHEETYNPALFQLIDFRIIGQLFLAGFVIFSFLENIEFNFIISGILLCFSMFLILKRKNLNRFKKIKLFTLSGKLEKKKTREGAKSYTVGRYNLAVPNHWIKRMDKIEDGREMIFTGYFMSKIELSTFTVISAGDWLSLQKEYEQIPPKTSARFVSAAVILLIGVLLQLSINDPLTKLDDYIAWNEFRDFQVEFSDFKSIKDEKFSRGRVIDFSGVNFFPVFDTYSESYQQLFLMTSKDVHLDVDFSEIQNRIDALKELQMTEEAVIIALNDLVTSDMEFYNAFMSLYDSINKKVIADFYEYFDDQYYKDLSDYLDTLLQNENVTSSQVSQLGTKYDNFLQNQVYILEELLRDKMKSALSSTDGIIIDFTEYSEANEPLYEFYNSEDSRFSKDSIRPFTVPTSFSSTTGEFNFREMVPAEITIGKIKNYVSKGFSDITVQGVISDVYYPDDDKPRLIINTNNSYDNINKSLGIVVTFLTTLGLFTLMLILSIIRIYWHFDRMKKIKETYCS
jgi:hypothetical protein